METITLTPYSDTDYDPVDILDATLSFPHGERRIERVPLIGGGNYFHDGGFTHSDRESTITGEVTRTTARLLDKWIQEDDFYIYFSDNEALYKAFIRSMDLSDGNVSISLYIESQELAYSDIVYPFAAPAPVAEWLDVTANTYWTATDFTWNGSGWDSSGGPGVFTVAGTWYTGFSPTQCRITFTGTDYFLFDPVVIRDATANTLYSGTPSSGVGFSIMTSTENIDTISVSPASGGPGFSFEITKIEFYGVKTW